MTVLPVRAAVGTDIGLRRSSNQDSAYAADDVFIVCDGMGGGVGGHHASAATVERFQALHGRRIRSRDTIEATLLAAQQDVLAIGRELSGISGTTISGLVAPHRADVFNAFCDDWYVINIGDSRTYHLNRNADGTCIISSISRITKDHSERQYLIDSGSLLPDMANERIPRNIITQCIGSPEGIEPDFFAVKPTGRFIICSDGLHAEISDEQIAVIAAVHPDPQSAVDALIGAALSAGGTDNITVVVVDMATTTQNLGESNHNWHATKMAPQEDLDTVSDETIDARRLQPPRPHFQEQQQEQPRAGKHISFSTNHVTK